MSVEPVKSAIAQHGNKVFNGLSAAALVWLYATFATKQELGNQAQRCEKAASEHWQKLMDHTLEIDRLKNRPASADLWNPMAPLDRMVDLSTNNYFTLPNLTTPNLPLTGK